MNEHKQSKFIIDVSASAKWPNRSTTRFFSYDSHTAEIVIQAEKDGKLIDQTLVDAVDIYFESVNMKYRPIDGLKWNDTMEIGTDGLYSYILPDDFLNYEGLVAFDMYINYKNGDRADSSNRIIFEQRVSAIDRAAGAVELVYIKDMEQAKQAVQATAADETAKIKAQLPIVEAVAMAETEKIQAELPKVAAVTIDEITKIKAELPKVQTVATEEIVKIRGVLPTVEQTAQEVSDHADQRIAEYDAKFVSTDQKMTELEQSQVALDAELKATQQQIIDADVYTKAEADANAEGILDKRNLSAAWSWSKDGTDRFTTVYPNLNLLDGTKDFSGTWLNLDIWTTDGTYKGLTVKKRTEQWRGIYKTFTAPKDGSYTFSVYVKSSGNSAKVTRYGGVNSTLSQSTMQKLVGDNFDWIRDSLILNLKANDYVWIRYEITGSGTDSILWTAGHKYEQGSTATPYMQSASEVTTADWPTYKGLRLAPSDNPADYDWSYTDEYVDYLKSSSVSKTEFNDLAARLAALENKEV